MLDIALTYLRRGWSVVPCTPGSKKPAIAWGDFTSRLPTEDEVKTWWTRWPSANIALITGKVSGVVAVDVDAYKGGKPEPIFNENPTQLISRTGGGGFHLLYDYPGQHVSNRVDSDSKVDVRGDGGYVILPPSTHSSGRPYSWVRTGNPGKAPTWLTLEKRSEAAINTSGGVIPERWLSEALAGAEDGNRNDTCTRIAGYFAGKGIPADVAVAVLQSWNAKNNPPLADAEIQTTVESTYKTAYRRSPPKEQPKKEFNVVSFNSYMSKYGDAAVKWMVEEWMPLDTVAFVISPPGSYKTWTVLDLVVSVASGRPFLGSFPVLEPGPVLLIQQEDYHGQVAERLGLVTAAKFGIDWQWDPNSENFYAPEAPDLPIYIHPDRLLRFDDNAIMEAVEAQVAKLKPRLCVLDPLYSAGNTDDYMAKTVEQMFRLKRMRDKYGTSFFIVHHTKKARDGVDTREQAWGSQFLNAFLETGWQLRPYSEEKDAITLERHFKVKARPLPLKLNFDISTEHPFRYKVQCEEFDMSKVDDKLNLLAMVEKYGPLNATDLGEKLNVHRSTIARKGAQLISKGVLAKTADGKFMIPEGKPAI